jgi:RND family efflux transporter MFP subunit
MRPRVSALTWIQWLVLSSLVGTLALLSTSCSKVGKAEGNNPNSASSSEPPRRVAVAKVERRKLSQSEDLMAEFAPYQEVDLHAKVAGYLKNIYVDVGDRVKQGQLLAVLEVPEQQADLDQAAGAVSSAQEEIKRAQSLLGEAEAAYNVAHITYARLAAVPKVNPHLIAQQEIDEAMAKDQEGEARVATAKAAISVARQKLIEAKASEDRIKTLMTYTRIQAPFTGTITKRYADTGAMIPAGTSESTQAMPLVRLSEDDILRLILPVPESVVGLIHVGGPVEVSVQSLRRSFTGTVWRFTDKVDVATRTMDTEIYVKNADRLLKPGMYATAHLTLDQAPSALAVPVQAVAFTQNKATVWTVGADNTLEERQVTTGAETPSLVEIVSGLAEGDLVVVGNRSELKQGQHVDPNVTELPETG